MQPSTVAVVLLAGDGAAYLTQLGGEASIVHTLRALAGSTRLQPLSSSVWLIADQGAADAFLGAGGLLDSLPVSLALSPSHVIVSSSSSSGNSSSYSQIPDLQLALSVISGSGEPEPRAVLVLPGTLTFLPGYNLQRVVEHGLVRGKSCVGMGILSQVESALHSGQSYSLVAVAEDVPVPQLSEIQNDCSPVFPGADVAQPLLLLQAADLPLVRSSGQATLLQLAAELISQGPLCGIDLRIGPLSLSTPAAIVYADALCKHVLSEGPIDSGPGIAAEDATARLMDSFHASYFGKGEADWKARGLPQWDLPPTFYMTQYRRSAAEILR